jgi:hypothetical protein
MLKESLTHVDKDHLTFILYMVYGLRKSGQVIDHNQFDAVEEDDCKAKYSFEIDPNELGYTH